MIRISISHEMFAQLVRGQKVVVPDEQRSPGSEEVVLAMQDIGYDVMLSETLHAQNEYKSR
jgi:hypothetical protein